MGTQINYVRGDTGNIAVHVVDGDGNDYDLTTATRARLSVSAVKSAWVLSTVYALGTVVKSIDDDNLRYECTVAGTSDTTEPTWPVSVDGTVADNDITWTARSKYQFQVDTAVHGADGLAVYTPTADATDEVTAPGALTDADDGNPGNPNGTYLYKVTFVCGARGETELGTVSGGVVVVTNKIDLTAIPTGEDGVVTARRIYRTKDSGSTYFLVTTLQDNSTTIYTDDVGDGDLTVLATDVNNTRMSPADYDYDSEFQFGGGTTILTPIIGTFSLKADVTRN